MEHRLSDTDPQTARVHLRMIREASVEKRLRLALSLSQSVIGLAHGGLSRRFPEASREELALRLVARLYGDQLADEVRTDLAARRQT